MPKQRGIDWFRRHVITKVPFPNPGFMRDVYPGFLQLNGFVSMNLERHIEAHKQLFLQSGARATAIPRSKHKEFYDEYLAVMDLAAEYYLQTVDTVFVRHALPKGEMTHRGRPVDLAKIKRVALLTIEGEHDDISGVGQTEAAHRLCVNIPADRKAHWLAAGRRPLRRVQRLALPRRDRPAHRRFHPVDGPHGAAARTTAPPSGAPQNGAALQQAVIAAPVAAFALRQPNRGSIAQSVCMLWMHSAMPLRALLYRRPSEPRTMEIVFDRSVYLVQLRRHRQARRYTLRIQATTREVILTIPPRGTLKEARRVRAKARRLDRGAARAAAGGGAVRRRHRGAAARRAAPHRAPPRHARHGVGRSGR